MLQIILDPTRILVIKVDPTSIEDAVTNEWVS